VQASAVPAPVCRGEIDFKQGHRASSLQRKPKMVLVHQRTGEKSGHNIAIDRPSASIEKKTTHGVVRRGTG
jgi:hypothetical protein